MREPSQLSASFAAVLRADRDRCNALFAQTRRQHPTLDGPTFADFLSTGVSPLVDAVSAHQPSAVQPVATAAYEIALELVGQGLAGARARKPFINTAWQRLLPAAAPLVAAAPARVLGAVCNALHHLSRTPDARPLAWIDGMLGVRPHVANDDVPTFLRLGQILAWHAGLAHFRPGALAIADTLPASLALLAVGAPATADWPAVRAALHADPWYLPGQPTTGPHLAGRAGAFRGFGGLFPVPPTVTSDGDQFFVRSGDGCWLLTADAFGATFHRAGSDECTAPAKLPTTLRFNQDQRTITVRHQQVPLTLPGPVTTVAATSDTLALTTAHSHAILFISLT